MTDMAECKHEPTKPVHRFEDAIYGQRMIGRDENYDRIFEDILCKYCGQQIHVPMLLTMPVQWQVKKNG